MKKFLKWTGLVLGGLLLLVLVAGTVLYFVGQSQFNEQYDVTPTLTTVPNDSALIARGEHLARIHGCQDCHTENFSGRVFVDAPPFRVSASNLTPGNGGIGDTYTDADWDRAIRYGIKPNGQAVVIMPSKTFHHLSDEDATALIAYLKSLPPVDNELPPNELRLPGAIMAGVGAVDLSESVHETNDRPPAPPPGPTAAYGAYLASITCIYCHGTDLHGGPNPDPGIETPVPDLAAAGAWPFEQFVQTMRTGTTPDGRQLDPEIMPWTAFRHMTDEELQAIQAHLKTLTQNDLAER